MPAFVFALSCAASSALAKSIDTRFEAQNYQKLPDPGTAPGLGSFDYRPYLDTELGNATISGRVSFALNDGETIGCNRAEEVYLYPDTPFTRWMIVKWAVLTNRKPLVPSPDYLAGISFPPWLETDKDDRSTAVRWSGCNDAGDFAFRQVPPGQYFVETLAIRYGGPPILGGGGGDVVQVDTPTGPQAYLTPSYSYGGHSRAASDYYILVSKFPIIVKDRAAASLAMTPEDLKTISHAFEK